MPLSFSGMAFVRIFAKVCKSIQSQDYLYKRLLVCCILRTFASHLHLIKKSMLKRLQSALGLITEDDLAREKRESYAAGRTVTAKQFRMEMDRICGMTAEEWCRHMYEYACQVEKEAQV